MKKSTLRAYDYVREKINTADTHSEGAPLWYGWALRQAFEDGANWERLRHKKKNAIRRPR